MPYLPPEKMAAILADDIFNCIFLNEDNRIPIQIYLILNLWTCCIIGKKNFQLEWSWSLLVHFDRSIWLHAWNSDSNFSDFKSMNVLHYREKTFNLNGRGHCWSTLIGPFGFHASTEHGANQYRIRRLIAKSDKVLKERYRSIQFSDRSNTRKFNTIQSFRGFETVQDLTLRRLVGYWNGITAFLH